MFYSFDVSIATEIGVDEAIMIQNLVFWISKNQANQKHYHDGRYWTYNSQQAFCELFPFWSRRQIQRILNSLEEKNIIIRANHNKSTYDRTGWYALTDLGHSIARNGSLHCTISCNGKRETVQPIPDINTNINTNINTDKYNVGQSPTVVIEVINYLNKKTGSSYKTSSKKNQSLIKARVNEGYKVEDFKKVIDNKFQDWHLTEMRNYLRPETLFGTKFESYLNQKSVGAKNETDFRIDEAGNKRDQFGLLIL